MGLVCRPTNLFTSKSKFLDTKLNLFFCCCCMRHSCHGRVSRAYTGSPCVAPTRWRTAAGQLNRGREVVVLLLWSILAASAPECVRGAASDCGGLDPTKSRWCCGMRQVYGSGRYEVEPATLGHTLKEQRCHTWPFEWTLPLYVRNVLACLAAAAAAAARLSAAWRRQVTAARWVCVTCCWWWLACPARRCGVRYSTSSTRTATASWRRPTTSLWWRRSTAVRRRPTTRSTPRSSLLTTTATAASATTVRSAASS